MLNITGWLDWRLLAVLLLGCRCRSQPSPLPRCQRLRRRMAEPRVCRSAAAEPLRGARAAGGDRPGRLAASARRPSLPRRAAGRRRLGFLPESEGQGDRWVVGSRNARLVRGQAA